MKVRALFVIVLLSIASASGATSLPAAARAYIDPALQTGAVAGPLPVIVMAGSAASAARAVRQVGGEVLADLWVANSVEARVPAARLAALARTRGVRSIVHNQPVSAADLQPSHLAGGRPADYVLLPYQPASLDLGIPEVHAVRERGASILGQGIAIAVVDSGIYFDRDLLTYFANDLRSQFAGQADFVEPACDGSGQQFADYCFTRYTGSRDPYGHGTAVASTIWNPYVDPDSGAAYGVAPAARLLSVRVLGDSGRGTYATVIRGLQYVVENRHLYNVRVVNLSLSAQPGLPYYADPLNQAVTRAWASGLVVVAAAGNTGPGASTITVPGNNPYVVTVGSYHSAGTFGQPADDFLPTWSATGPTLDGFAKPDVLAPGVNIMTFMYNDPTGDHTQALAHLHPDYVLPAVGVDNSDKDREPDYVLANSFFRMNGTSLSTGLASGVVALMLQANPALTPDQVKYRLHLSAVPMLDGEGQAIYNTFEQGMGRLWAPYAVLGTFDSSGIANATLDPLADGSQSPYPAGPVGRVLGDEGLGWLYFLQNAAGEATGLGVSTPDGRWLDSDTTSTARMTWAGARMTWAGTTWSGMTWAGARMTWAGSDTQTAARMTWSGTAEADSAARMTWAGARMTWAGTAPLTAEYELEPTARMTWAGTTAADDGTGASGEPATGDTSSSARMTWAGTTGDISATQWVDGD